MLMLVLFIGKMRTIVISLSLSFMIMMMEVIVMTMIGMILTMNMKRMVVVVVVMMMMVMSIVIVTGDFLNVMPLMLAEVEGEILLKYDHVCNVIRGGQVAGELASDRFQLNRGGETSGLSQGDIRWW
eukprot:349547-Hanusia_phi.AAC.1